MDSLGRGLLGFTRKFPPPPTLEKFFNSRGAWMASGPILTQIDLANDVRSIICNDWFFAKLNHGGFFEVNNCAKIALQFFFFCATFLCVVLHVSHKYTVGWQDHCPLKLSSVIVIITSNGLLLTAFIGILISNYTVPHSGKSQCYPSSKQ